MKPGRESERVPGHSVLPAWILLALKACVVRFCLGTTVARPKRTTTVNMTKVDTLPPLRYIRNNYPPYSNICLSSIHVFMFHYFDCNFDLNNRNILGSSKRRWQWFNVIFLRRGGNNLSILQVIACINNHTLKTELINFSLENQNIFCICFDFRESFQARTHCDIGLSTTRFLQIYYKALPRAFGLKKNVHAKKKMKNHTFFDIFSTPQKRLWRFSF